MISVDIFLSTANGSLEAGFLPDTIRTTMNVDVGFVKSNPPESGHFHDFGEESQIQIVWNEVDCAEFSLPVRDMARVMSSSFNKGICTPRARARAHHEHCVTAVRREEGLRPRELAQRVDVGMREVSSLNVAQKPRRGCIPFGGENVERVAFFATLEIEYPWTLLLMGKQQRRRRHQGDACTEGSEEGSPRPGHDLDAKMLAV